MTVLTLATSLKFFYLALVLIVISLMAFYVRGLTSAAKEKRSSRLNVAFYCWIGFLVAIAILFHVFTAWKVPWVHWEISRSRTRADQEISITAGKHQFRLPAGGLRVQAGKKIKFKVLSDDLTYGFGVFRRDGGLEFQMQVLPGHSNEIIWIFSSPGQYSIRSTEYAGLDTGKMYLKDILEVLPAEGK